MNHTILIPSQTVETVPLITAAKAEKRQKKGRKRANKEGGVLRISSREIIKGQEVGLNDKKGIRKEVNDVIGSLTERNGEAG
jgi:hypothetical protein